MRPSTVAGGTGVAAPEKRAHWRAGAYALVAVADQPLGVAWFTTTVTPAEGVRLFICAKLVV